MSSRLHFETSPQLLRRFFSFTLYLKFQFLVQAMCLFSPAESAEDFLLTPPLGLPDVPVPADNPLTASKVALGKQLFFDPRLSKEEQFSCSTCHNPAKGWTDGEHLPKGRDGNLLRRGVPPLTNLAYHTELFWDGRASSLEEAVLLPIVGEQEMGMPLDELVDKLNAIDGYRSQFLEVFESPVNETNISQAIASYLRTLLAGDAPLDRFRAGEFAALSPEAIRGHDVFFFRTNCSSCHRGPLLSDGSFQNLGIGMDQDKPDLARYEVTRDDYDKGRFKTPSLRDISRTSPYMHDGRFKSLQQVIDFYEEGGIYNAHLSPQMNTIPLSDIEKRSLLRFLQEGLESHVYPLHVPPELPQ